MIEDLLKAHRRSHFPATMLKNVYAFSYLLSLTYMIDNSANAVKIATDNRSISRFLQNIESIVDHRACKRSFSELLHLNSFLKRLLHVILFHRDVFAHYALQLMREGRVPDPVF